MEKLNGEFKVYHLRNGLSVALQRTPTKTIAGNLTVYHGALNERNGEEGLAHYLEHLIVTGGSEKYSPRRIDETRDRLGSFNARTSLDKTYFPVEMLSEDVELYLDFVSDISFNPRFDSEKMEEERQRILREITDRTSSPSYMDGESANKAFFGEDSPHIYNIGGKREVVENATIEDLKKFHSGGYSPNNMRLILVGTLPENIEEIVEEKFGEYEIGGGRVFEFPRNKPLKEKTILHTQADDLLNKENSDASNAFLEVRHFAPNEKSEDHHAVVMLKDILGGSGNSRIFKKISRQMGLAYGIGSYYNGLNNKGIFWTAGKVHAPRAGEAIDAVFSEMKDVRENLVDQSDLDKYKREARFHFAKSLETNGGHVNAIYRFLERGFTPEKLLDGLDKVSREDVRDVARRYLPENREEGKYVLLLRDPLKK